MSDQAQHDYDGIGILPDALAFKSQLESCLCIFRKLVNAMVQSTKDLQHGRKYLRSITLQLDDKLVRLEIWKADSGVNDCGFGRLRQPVDRATSSTVPCDLKLTRYLTSVLAGLTSHLEEVQTQMEIMQPLIEQMTGKVLEDA